LPAQLIEQFEALIRRDPARRGLIGTEPEFGALCPGHLAAAAAHLAACGSHVAIVTGFFIPKAEPPCAETDGPLGAVLLASLLEASGIRATIVTDRHCWPAVVATVRAGGLRADQVWAGTEQGEGLAEEFFRRGPGQQLSHLIAIERVGPSHTPQSLCQQRRAGVPPLDEFLQLVPPEHQNRCHNMRGEMIDEHTASLHVLFEQLDTYHPAAVSIGIGDGGNEIGMGSIPWEEISRRLEGERAKRIPCRIATRWNIIAGTSNWGGCALAAATLLLRGAVQQIAPYTREHQQQVLQTLVAEGCIVDGVTRRCECTVDGLPFLTYIQPWDGMRRLLGLPE